MCASACPPGKKKKHYWMLKTDITALLLHYDKVERSLNSCVNLAGIDASVQVRILFAVEMCILIGSII